MSKILVVEDERKMQAGIRDNLEMEGHRVECVSDGKGAVQCMLENTYDLVVLDVMLPHMSGFDVLRKVRESGIRTPVILLTAKGEEVDKVLGLELGADDYITKPFGLREFLARVKAVLRRYEAGAVPAPAKMELDDLIVDFTAYSVSRGGSPVEMTPKEIEVLRFLWTHRNQTVTREQLLSNVWGYDEEISTRTVDNFILRIRQKIEKDPSSPRRILTLHGVGYKLVS